VPDLPATCTQSSGRRASSSGRSTSATSPASRESRAGDSGGRGDILIIGDQAGKVFSPDGWLLGHRQRTGALAWKTRLEGGFPIITASAVVAGGVAYVGSRPTRRRWSASDFR